MGKGVIQCLLEFLNLKLLPEQKTTKIIMVLLLLLINYTVAFRPVLNILLRGFIQLFE